MNLQTIKQIEKNYQVNLYPKREISLIKGKGMYLYDSLGNKYLDMFSNIGVNILGYGNKKIENQINSQVKQLISCHQSFYNDSRAKFLKKIIEILPKSINKISFSNSGSETVEAAIKYSRVATGRKTIISCLGSYHGRTLGALAATGQEKYQKPYLPMLPGFKFIKFNSCNQLESILNNEVAAVIIEPIQGEGGVIPATQKFINEIAYLCNKHGILLIIDEVQTAIRTGKWFAFEHFKIVPDIICCSKSWSYGLPFGLTAVTNNIAEKIPFASHGSTFAGNPLVCQIATTVIEIINKKNLLMKTTQIGSYFKNGLLNINNPKIKEVRGVGLMIGLELNVKPTPILKTLQQKGIIATLSGQSTIRFLPPLIIRKKHIDKVLLTIKEVLSL